MNNIIKRLQEPIKIKTLKLQIDPMTENNKGNIGRNWNKGTNSTPDECQRITGMNSVKAGKKVAHGRCETYNYFLKYFTLFKSDMGTGWTVINVRSCPPAYPLSPKCLRVYLHANLGSTFWVASKKPKPCQSTQTVYIQPCSSYT